MGGLSRGYGMWHGYYPAWFSPSQLSNCCRSRKYIWCHIPVHAIFCHFLNLFSYLFYLGHFSLTATLLLSVRSSPITWRYSWAPQRPPLCMLLTMAHKKGLAQKVACFGSLEWIPMIQAPFNTSCTATLCRGIARICRKGGGWLSKRSVREARENFLVDHTH